LGYLQLQAEQHTDFGLLVIDAHMDLRKAYEGFTYSHASIFYNALEQLPQIKKLVQVGIRDYCHEEKEYVEQSENRIQIFYDRDMRAKIYQGISWASICEEIVESLPDKVYLSVDIDGLDPKLCPNTGTPVPGGLEYEELVYLLNTLQSSGKTIIGFDLCEVSPGDSDWDGNVGARLLFHLCGVASGS
jgi:agmatinase